jgi:nickel superoxide dismutase
MKKLFSGAIITACVFLLCAVSASAHCEIPCGIYDDAMRIKMINEHIATIEKSMKQIMELEKADHRHSNQLIRWVMNKENHASELQEIVTQYFMTQRIKPGAKDYDKKLHLLHAMLVYAMKCKQTTDLANVGKLRDLVKGFEALYFEKE